MRQMHAKRRRMPTPATANPGGNAPGVTIPGGGTPGGAVAARRRRSTAAGGPVAEAHANSSKMIPSAVISRKSRGAALMAVLWLIAILAMACMATLRVISFDMELASAKVHGSRARQVAEMGIAIGSNPVVKRSDPMLRQMNEETGEGFEVRVISEGGRFNINSIILQDDKALLQIDVHRLGPGTRCRPGNRRRPRRLGGCRRRRSPQRRREKILREGGRINQPFNRPFYDLSEVRLVRGMDLVEAVRPDWRNWFTIWSSGALDLNEAPAELIAAAAEIPVEQADIIPETVRGTDGLRDTDRRCSLSKCRRRA